MERVRRLWSAASAIGEKDDVDERREVQIDAVRTPESLMPVGLPTRPYELTVVARHLRNTSPAAHLPLQCTIVASEDAKSLKVAQSIGMTTVSTLQGNEVVGVGTDVVIDQLRHCCGS